MRKRFAEALSVTPLRGGSAGALRIRKGIQGVAGGERRLMGLRDAIAGYVSAIGGYLLGRDIDAVVPSERSRLADAVEDARQQWVAAKAFFDDVTDPQLIDYAVFSIGAAEKRYMFLLEEARRQGVRVHPLRVGW